MLGQEIEFSSVEYGIKGDNTQQIIRNMARMIGRDVHSSAMSAHHEMEKSLKSATSTIGEGVAIFDWSSRKIDIPYVMCVRLENSVQFSVVDDKAIDIILVLVSPESSGSIHLQSLSRLTRMFRDTKLVDSLRSATCADGMLSVLSPENRRLAA